MRAYTKRQYYLRGNAIYRNESLVSTFEKEEWASDHAEGLNKQFGDLEAYELLNGIRNEITLYEDGEFTAETIVESIKAILDSRQKT